MLTHAEKWHTLREEFSIGVLALVPQGGNTWFEKLPLKDLPVYFYLVRAVNPVAVSMGEMIANRVSSSWRGEEPPEQLLRLEHLETIDEISSRANPLKLLEEINVGCTTGRRCRLDGIESGRAVTMPADVGENTTALEALFSGGGHLGLGPAGFPSEAHDSRLLSRPARAPEEYPPSSDYFDDINPSDFICNGNIV